MEIKASYGISMGHRLPSYDGICASPHGHNVRFEAVVRAPGFVDFKRVSDVMKEELGHMDHAMVLHDLDPLLAALRFMDKGFRLVALSVEPTTEALATLAFNKLAARGLDVTSVTVYETDRYSATATEGRESVREVRS